MLQKMRNSVSSWIAKVILGLLILAFASWGVTINFDFSLEGQEIASAGDIEISPQEYGFALSQQARNTGLTPAQMRDYGLADQVLQNLISRGLLEAEGREIGLTSTDAMLVRSIQSNPQFQNNGRFDQGLYELALSNMGLNPPYYEFNLKRDLVIRSMLDTVDSSLTPSSALVDQLYLFRNENRDVSFFRLPVDETTELEKPARADLEKFYEERKETFRAPEYRKITYVAISRDVLAKDIEPSDEQLREAYDQRLDSYTTPEERQVQQMLLGDEETARKAKEALDQGQDFAAVANEFAGMSAGDIALGSMKRNDIPDDALANAVFALEDGTYSEPQEGIFGWFIVKVDGIKPSSSQPFEEVRESLAREIALEEAGDRAYSINSDFDDRVGGGATLEEAAQALNLKAVTIPAIDRQGRDRNEAEITGLPNRSAFLEFAYDTDIGMDSLMQDDDNGGFFILRVDDSEDSRIKPLSEVEAQALALWEQDARRKLTEAKADELTARINEGDSIINLSSAENADIQVALNLTRTGETANRETLPSALVSNVFELQPGKSTNAFAGDAYVIAVLDKVNVPDLAAARDSVQVLQDNVQNAMRNDIILQFTAALREKHGVAINQTRLQTLLAQQ